MPVADLAAHFLAAAAQAPAAAVARLATQVCAEHFERPHDGIIWAAIVAQARHAHPSLPLVCQHLTSSGLHTREVKARMLELASVPAWPEQLERLAPALRAQAWRRTHREGLHSLIEHLDNDSDQEAVLRLLAHVRRVQRLNQEVPA